MHQEAVKKPLVIHLEMPRGLSLTVKSWRQDLYQALRSQGIEYQQIDLNPGFWRFYLNDRRTGLFEQLLNLRYQTPAFNLRAVEAASKYLRRYQTGELHPDFAGFSLRSDITSATSNLLEWVKSDAARHWLFPWIESFSEKLSDAEVVSLAVGSPDELAVAAAMAEYLRLNLPHVHSILSYHRWENFTLAPKLEALVVEGELLQLFDSVVLREDRAGDCLAGLGLALASGELDALQYIGTTIDGQARLIGHREAATKVAQEVQAPDAAEARAIAAYLQALELRPERILMLEALVRNDCHYGRCTFCVQNLGYPVHQQFKHRPELERSLVLVNHLASEHGVRSFSFIDQALAGAMARRVSERLLDMGIDIHWCCRMLPDQADMDLPCLQLMASAGCKEILIGLESTLPDTLEFMGKQPFDEGRAMAWVERCAEAGIDVTLSAIKNFPTESEQDFLGGTGKFLSDCAARFAHINIILNIFNLFSLSQIAQSPGRYNIAEIKTPASDLVWFLEYVDGYGRDSESEIEPFCLGLPFVSGDVQYLHYSSFGLLHRWQTRQWLFDAVAEASDGESVERFADRDIVIVGSEGYLGCNLVNALPSGQVILSSRRTCANNSIDAPYVSEDLTEGYLKLAQLRPKVVWICARPYCDQFDVHARFNYHLERLLNLWAEAGCLERVFFFSTQLVTHTPGSEERISGQTPLAPEEAYDYAKADMEVFCGYLARKYRLAMDVIRLPLLWGGQLPEGQRDKQLLYYWHDRLQAGDYWEIGPGQERFGNSWVDVEDLLAALVATDPAGLRVRTVRSGDFTYAQLMQHWRVAGGHPGDAMPLIESRYLVEDEIGLRKRDLFLYEC